MALSRRNPPMTITAVCYPSIQLLISSPSLAVVIFPPSIIRLPLGTGASSRQIYPRSSQNWRFTHRVPNSAAGVGRRKVSSQQEWSRWRRQVVRRNCESKPLEEPNTSENPPELKLWHQVWLSYQEALTQQTVTDSCHPYGLREAAKDDDLTSDKGAL